MLSGNVKCECGFDRSGDTGTLFGGPLSDWGGKFRVRKRVDWGGACIGCCGEWRDGGVLMWGLAPGHW